MGLLSKLKNGASKLVKGNSPRWLVTLLVATTIAGVVGTTYFAFVNDNDVPPSALIEKMHDEMQILKSELTKRYGSSITEILSVSAQKGAEGTATGVLDIIALAKTTKGKQHYVNFSFDVANDKLEVINTYEDSATEAVTAYEENTNAKKSKELAEAMTTAMLDYVSEISECVEYNTSEVKIESITLGETLEQTVIKNDEESTTAYTGKGILELACRFLSNQGLSSIKQTAALYEQVKPVLADTSLKLQNNIVIDLENSSVTIGTKVNNTVHYIGIDLTNVITSTDTAEAKKQATDYVLAMLKAAEEGTLTTEQLSAIDEYDLADVSSNRLFTIVGQIAGKTHNSVKDLTE